jgi:hypothetical protein
MDEAAIQRIMQKNNEQLLAQMSSLISTTVQGLKRSNEDQAPEQLQEIKNRYTRRTCICAKELHLWKIFHAQLLSKHLYFEVTIQPAAGY